MFKEYTSKYLNPKAVFTLDWILLVVASALVLLVTNFFASSEYYSGEFALWWMGSAVVCSAVALWLFKSYRIIIRHTSLQDLYRYLLPLLVKDVLMGLVILIACIFNTTILLALICDFLVSHFLLIGMRLCMFALYSHYLSHLGETAPKHKVLMFGDTDSAVSSVADVKHSSYVRDVKIEDLLGRPEIKLDMDQIRANFKDKVVMVTGAAGSIGSELCRQLASFGVKQLVLFDNAETPMHNLRLELEAKYPQDVAKQRVQEFKSSKVQEAPHSSHLTSHTPQPEAVPLITPVIGSVRHKARVDYAFRKFRPQVVFHAAAFKHVPLMEENPCEAVFANVFGSRIIADKCVEYGVEMMVMISTDKAVNPTNIMGCSKRLAEIYVQSLGVALNRGEVQEFKGSKVQGVQGEISSKEISGEAKDFSRSDKNKTSKTKFVTTRFGNVLGSNGSVIPRFREQIAKGGPVTVTHPDITRFFMTIPEACRLVMEAATMSTGNQIFVFDMGESVKIADLARRMIELSGLKVDEDIKIEYTGLRPGEKLYEEVLANTENTIPTDHKRIRIAKVREYDYQKVCDTIEELTVLAKEVRIPEMVKLMKEFVPEFISKNSEFERFDK